jgi:hypothetical protein
MFNKSLIFSGSRVFYLYPHLFRLIESHSGMVFVRFHTMMKPVFFLSFLLLLFPVIVKAQEPDSIRASFDNDFLLPDYQKLYDYSRMNDTTITEYGNTDMSGNDFHPRTGKGLCCFAIRTIKVQKGKLREVYILDSNTGIETTRIYDENGKINIKRRVDNDAVRNAPPYR